MSNDPVENYETKVSAGIFLLTLPIHFLAFAASNLVGHIYGSIRDGWRNSIAP